jgi:hypothetical protein
VNVDWPLTKCDAQTTVRLTMKGRPKWRRLLNSRNLDDVPFQIRIGSPYDAPNRLVVATAKQGFLHPATNYGVVYRVAFRERMQPEERPQNQALRFIFAKSIPWVEGRKTPVPTKEDGAWLLITTWGLRWHYWMDGVPGTAPSPEAPRPSGPRDAAFGDLQSVPTVPSVIDAGPGPFSSRTPMRLHGFAHRTSAGPYLHVFVIATDRVSAPLMRWVREQIADAHADR